MVDFKLSVEKKKQFAASGVFDSGITPGLAGNGVSGKSSVLDTAAAVSGRKITYVFRTNLFSITIGEHNIVIYFYWKKLPGFVDGIQAKCTE